MKHKMHPECAPAAAPPRASRARVRFNFGFAAALLAAVCAMASDASGEGQARVVSTGGAWRLAVLTPGPEGLDPSAAALCVEVSGDVREALVALEITPLSGGAPVASSVRAEGAIGRSQVIANLGVAGEGQFDLRVQLVVEGARQSGPSVVVPAVTLRRGAARGVCAWEKQR
ncbi:MAG: hypothetical protein IPH55_01130 [Betaproteobacteria bacterium]|nr:hypothetical protein [Betaproteobacteria bacterium]